jgi:16S rRNA (guanine1516-N2)-methyltransferase
MPNFFLIQTPEGLGLKSTLPELKGLFHLDYLQGNLGFRLTPERVLHEPLAKVIDKKAWVIDTTGGLGKDGLMLTMMGCKVWMCEAHPLLSALILDALARAKADPKFNVFLEHSDKFQFFPEDAKNILEKLVDLPKENRPEIVYLDPMFPMRKKSSLVKKEMQWLKAIHDEPNPTEQTNADNAYLVTCEEALFELALKTATKRVIVKRPLHAPTLVQTPAPTFSKLFQSARFDVYLP